MLLSEVNVHLLKNREEITYLDSDSHTHLQAIPTRKGFYLYQKRKRKKRVITIY